MDDLQQVILDEVRATRVELKAHIKDEDVKFNEVRKDIVELKTAAALHKQRANTVNAAWSIFISGIVAWFVTHFGVK